MSYQILNDTGVIVGLLGKRTLAPIFLSESFKALIGSRSEDILQFLQSKDGQLTKEKMLEDDGHLLSQFITEIRKKRFRKMIDFKVSHDSLGDILIYGEDITNAQKLESLLKSYTSLLEKQQKLYKKMAYSDSLTGIPNRRAFFKHCEESFGKEANTSSSVCILDIDHFKKVNDNHGHGFGDEVLKYFGQQIIKGLDEQCFFARTGGEEFCVFSRNRTSEQLRDLLSSVLEMIRSKTINTPNKGTLTISFSAGAVEYKKDGVTLDELLIKADKALYSAKAIGRSRVISYSSDLCEEQDKIEISA